VERFYAVRKSPDERALSLSVDYDLDDVGDPHALNYGVPVGIDFLSKFKFEPQGLPWGHISTSHFGLFDFQSLRVGCAAPSFRNHC